MLKKITNFRFLYCFICFSSFRIVWIFARFTVERNATICIPYNTTSIIGRIHKCEKWRWSTPKLDYHTGFTANYIWASPI